MNHDIPGKPAEVLPGPILLDGLLQSFLLGTIVNQAFKYVLDYRDDSWRKRAFVISMIGLSILQTILEDYKAWRTLILDRRWSTSVIEWSDLFLNGCICWLCEGFYIRRCWKMMEKKTWVIAPLTILSMFIMAANFYLAVAMGIAFRSLEGTDDTLTASHFLLPSTIVAFSFWIFGSLGTVPCDVIESIQHFIFFEPVLEIAVTVLLMVSLWHSRTGLREVDKTVMKVIHITWESAILPSICMVIAVGLYHARPRIDDHLVLFFVLLTGKFYTFGMLRTLNSRAKLRSDIQGQAQELGRTSLSDWDWDQATLQPSDGRKDSDASILEVPNTSGSSLNQIGRSSRPRSNENLDAEPPFASSIQLSTPCMEAQEIGRFRHRICS